MTRNQRDEIVLYNKNQTESPIHKINENWPGDYDNQDDNYDVLTEQWYPPVEWMNYKDTWYMKIYFQGDRFWNYCYSFYYSILFMSQNEAGPVNITQLIIISVLLLFGLLIEALVLSKIAVLLANMKSG